MLVREANGMVLDIPEETTGDSIIVIIIELGKFWSDPSRIQHMAIGQRLRMIRNPNSSYFRFEDHNLPWIIYDPILQTLEHYR